MTKTKVTGDRPTKYRPHNSKIMKLPKLRYLVKDEIFLAVLFIVSGITLLVGTVIWAALPCPNEPQSQTTNSHNLEKSNLFKKKN